MLEKLEFNFVYLKAGNFNVQLWTYAEDWRRFLKAGDLASLLVTLDNVLENSGCLIPVFTNHRT
jgi:hypothetical protein